MLSLAALPGQKSPFQPELLISIFPLNTTLGVLGNEIERVCIENELILTNWSPIHLREKLKQLYWNEKLSAINAMDFWEDSLRLLYMPRLKNRTVLARTIQSGVSSRDFFATAYGKNGDEFEGFHFGSGMIEFDHTLLLINPDIARAYEKSHRMIPGNNNVPLTNTTAISLSETIEMPAALLSDFLEKLTVALEKTPRATIKITLEI